MSGQTEDLSKLSPAQHKAAIAELAKLPTRELRRRQHLTELQLQRAGGNLIAARNLQIRELHLAAAIDQREFGTAN